MGFFDWFEKAVNNCKTTCDNLVNGSKYREEARHYQQISDRLEQNYAELLKKYQEFEQRAKEEINAYAYELTKKTWECDRLRLVVDLQREVITLIELAYRTASEDIRQQLGETVYYTNLVLKELGIEPIRVSLLDRQLSLSFPELEVESFIPSYEVNKANENQNYVVLDNGLLQNLSSSILKKWTGASAKEIRTDRDKSNFET